MINWIAQSNKGFRIKTFGDSMFPLLQDGDIVSIKKVKFKHISVNDIICFKRSRNLITHRVIYKTPRYIITKGDSNTSSDGKIKKSQIIGKVNKVRRNRTIIDIDNYYLFQSSIYFTEIRRVVERLNNDGINSVILKGLPLHLYLEKKHPRRIYADCDLLIDKTQYQKVELVLKKMGYRKVTPLSLTGKVMEEKAEISFYKIVNGFYVEFDIHRDVVFLMTRVGKVDMLYPQRLVEELNHKFLQEKVNIEIEKFIFPILTPENLLVYLCLHIYHHNFSGAYRYEFVGKVLKKNISVKKVLDTIIEYKLWNFVFATLFLYGKYYDSKFSLNPFYKELKKISNFKLIEKKVGKINIFDEQNNLGEGNYFRMLFSFSPNPFWKKILILFDLNIIYAVLWVLNNKMRRIILHKFPFLRGLLKVRFQ